MRLLNLFTREDHEIVAPEGLGDPEQGRHYLLQPSKSTTFGWNLGTAAYALSPVAERDVLKLREIMVAALESDNLSDPDLVTFDSDIRVLYLNLMEQMFAQAGLVTADSEPECPGFPSILCRGRTRSPAPTSF